MLFFTGPFDLATRGVIEQSLASGELVASVLSKGGKVGRKSAKDFAKNLGKVAKVAAKFLNGVGVIVNFVLMFLPGEAELLHKELLERFDRIDNKLRSISNKLDLITNKIEWQADKDKYDTYVDHIKSFEKQLAELGNSSSKALKREIMLQKKGNDMSGRLLVRLILRGEIIDNYFIETKKDRAATLAFLATSLDYIITGAQVDIAYLQLKYFDNSTDPKVKALIQDEIRFWDGRIKEVENVMKAWDDKIASDYSVIEQSHLELEEYVKDPYYLGFSNLSFIYAMLEKLEKKYFWRKWIVVTAKYPKYGERDFCFHQDKYVWSTFYYPGSVKRWLIVANYPADTHPDCQADLNEFKSEHNAIDWEWGVFGHDCKRPGHWIHCDNMVCDAKNRYINENRKSDGFAIVYSGSYASMLIATSSGTSYAYVNDLENCGKCKGVGYKAIAYC